MNILKKLFGGVRRGDKLVDIDRMKAAEMQQCLRDWGVGYVDFVYIGEQSLRELYVKDGYGVTNKKGEFLYEESGPNKGKPRVSLTEDNLRDFWSKRLFSHITDKGEKDRMLGYFEQCVE